MKTVGSSSLEVCKKFLTFVRNDVDRTNLFLRK